VFWLCCAFTAHHRACSTKRVAKAGTELTPQTPNRSSGERDSGSGGGAGGGGGGGGPGGAAALFEATMHLTNVAFFGLAGASLKLVARGDRRGWGGGGGLGVRWLGCRDWLGS
jgi:hypothetical protein